MSSASKVVAGRAIRTKVANDFWGQTRRGALAHPRSAKCKRARQKANSANTSFQQQTQRTLLNWLRVDYGIEKPNNKLSSYQYQTSDSGNVIRSGKNQKQNQHQESESESNQNNQNQIFESHYSIRTYSSSRFEISELQIAHGIRLRGFPGIFFGSSQWLRLGIEFAGQ